MALAVRAGDDRFERTAVTGRYDSARQRRAVGGRRPDVALHEARRRGERVNGGGYQDLGAPVEAASEMVSGTLSRVIPFFSNS